MNLTGSGFARAEACALSTVLPGVVEPPNPYAEGGNAVHRYLCLVAKVGAEAALELVEEPHRSVCAVIDLDALPHSHPEGWGVEVAFAWDPNADTARELHRGSGERNYSGLSPVEVPGTADLVGLDGDTVIILDLKTGWRPLGDPKTSLQLGFYAVAAALAYGATKAVVGYVRLTDGEPRYEYATLDEFELMAMAQRLKDVLVAAEDAALQHEAGIEVTPKMGEHCRYCPAYLRCPAQATLLRELVVDAGKPEALPVISEEKVGAALERLWLAQAMLERLEKSLEEYAREHPVTLPDGRIYGPVEVSTEAFDPIIGGDAIAAAFGDAIAQEAVEVKRTLTKAGLARVLKEKVLEPGGKFAPLERKAHELIRAAGGSRVTSYVTVKAIKPKRLNP